MTEEISIKEGYKEAFLIRFKNFVNSQSVSEVLTVSSEIAFQNEGLKVLIILINPTLDQSLKNLVSEFGINTQNRGEFLFTVDKRILIFVNWEDMKIKYLSTKNK